jgi:hypothetical protein
VKVPDVYWNKVDIVISGLLARLTNNAPTTENVFHISAKPQILVPQGTNVTVAFVFQKLIQAVVQVTVTNGQNVKVQQINV